MSNLVGEPNTREESERQLATLKRRYYGEGEFAGEAGIITGRDTQTGDDDIVWAKPYKFGDK